MLRGQAVVAGTGHLAESGKCQATGAKPAGVLLALLEGDGWGLGGWPLASRVMGVDMNFLLSHSPEEGGGACAAGPGGEGAGREGRRWAKGRSGGEASRAPGSARAALALELACQPLLCQCCLFGAASGGAGGGGGSAPLGGAA